MVKIVVFVAVLWFLASVLFAVFASFVLRAMPPDVYVPPRKPDYCKDCGWSFEHGPDCEIVVYPEWAREARRQRMEREKREKRERSRPRRVSPHDGRRGVE